MSETFGGENFDAGTVNATASTSLEWRDIPGLILLSLKIFFLRIITLGIYYFWGKTEVRRKLWAAVHLEGQPLEYTGKGKELFFGFLIVLFLVFWVEELNLLALDARTVTIGTILLMGVSARCFQWYLFRKGDVE